MLKPARINVKVLLILVLVVVVLGGGAAIGYKIRKKAMANSAKEAGLAAVAKEDWAEACKQLKFYLSKYPDDQEMLAQFGDANLVVKPRKLGAAIGAYRRLLRSRPGDNQITERLAGLYTQIGDYGEVAHICRARLKADAKDTDAALNLSRALLMLREFDEASKILEKLVAEHPDQVTAYAFLTTLARLTGPESADTAAAAWLDQGVQANPQSAEARIQRARFRREVQKNRSLAREDLEAADSLGPTDPDLMMSLAQEWLALGDRHRAKAASAALRAIDLAELSPWETNPEAFHLGRLMLAGTLALMDENKAVACAGMAERGLEELAGRYRMAFMPLAVRLYLATADTQAARRLVDEYSEEIIKAAPDDSSQKDRLAIVDAFVADAEGRPHRTIELLEPLIAKNIEFAEAWKLLGRAYSQIGQQRRGIEILKVYADSAQGDVEILLLLAASHQGSNPKKAAQYAIRAQRVIAERGAGMGAVQALKARLVLLEVDHERAAASKDRDRLQQISAKLTALRASHPSTAEIYILEASVAKRDGRLDDAIALLEEAIVQADDKMLPALTLARYYDENDRLDDAIGACRRAIQSRPDLADPRVGLFELLWVADRRQEATDVLKRAVGKLEGAERVTVRIKLAQCAGGEGRHEEAIRLLRGLAEENPKDTRMPLLLLQMPEINSDPAEAQRWIDALESIEGDRGLHWRLEQARHWQRSEDWNRRAKESEELLTYCRAADLGWREPAVLLGMLYEKLGATVKAERTYRNWIGVSPGDTFVVDRLLRLLEKQGRFAEASHILDVRLSKTAADATTLAPHRASLAIARRDYREAAKELEGIIAENPTDVDSRVTLARLLSVVSKDTEGAIRLLDEAMEFISGRQRFVILDAKAQILWSANRRAEVHAMLDADVKQHDDFVAYLLRARYLAAAGELERAEADCKRLTAFEESSAEGYQLLGLFYVEHDRVQEAIRAFDDGLDANADNMALKFELVKACLASESESDHSRARKLLGELLAEAPDDAALLQLRSHSLLRAKTEAGRQEAVAILEDVIRRKPGAVSVYIDLIRLLRALGQIEKAEQIAAQGLGANRDNSLLLLEMADLELAKNQPLLAEQRARRVLSRERGNVNALNLLSHIALQRGDVQTASSHNRTACQLAPDDGTARLIEAKILAAQGRGDDAIQALKSLLETEFGGEMVGVRITLAELHAREQNYAAAQDLLDEAAALAPGYRLVVRARVALLVAQAEYGGIAELLSAHLEKNPKDVLTVLDGVSMLMNAGGAGCAEKAGALLDEVLAVTPESVAAHGMAARVALRSGNIDASIESYRKVLKLEPENSEALNDLAWILAEEKDDAEAALELANRGVRRHPSDTHLRDTRGVVLHKLGELEAAKADLATCIELIGRSENPTELRTRGQALFHLGRVLTDLGEIDQARENLTAALDLDARLNIFSDRERAELKALLGSGER